MTLLVLTQPGHRANTYGAYALELLRAEGFAGATARPLGEALPDLDGADAVVLTACLPPKAHVDALAAYVRRGGRLVVLRPSRVLATALGLVPTDTVTYPAYVRPGAGTPIGAGVPQEAIQTHVPADNYEPARLPPGAREVARLHAGNAGEAPTSFPAALHLPLGEGQVVAFLYDLPQAVALIRQGNPALAGGWRTVGYSQPYRPVEAFTGWLDPSRAHLPQADIHTMLLGNAVNAVARAPQPRWWYYPAPAQTSAVVLDSDDDWSRPEHFDALIDTVERHDGHLTVYLMMGPTRGTIATPEKVAAWRARGHSFGIHHNPFDPVYAEEEQDDVVEGLVRRDIATFREHYGDVPLTNRNHSLAWKGYVDLPKVYAAHGVLVDLNYLCVFQFRQTYLTGSDRPVRFVDLDGEVIDCFQQATIAFDDASVKAHLSADPAGEAARTLALLEEKRTRYFSPLSMLSHPVSFFTYSRAYMELVWGGARELGVPIWSAFEWAAFVSARDQARILDAHWAGGDFACTVSGRSPRGSLTLMVPLEMAPVEMAPPGAGAEGGQRAGDGLRASVGGEVRGEVDGEPVPVPVREVFGWRYALVPVPLDETGEARRRVTLRTAV